MLELKDTLGNVSITCETFTMLHIASKFVLLKVYEVK